jgi:hypothetical protein
VDLVLVEGVQVRSDGWSSHGPDYSAAYHQQAQQLARQFAIMEGVVGVLLTGGLTFGEADRYSNIDLTVYLRQQSLRTWYFGEAPLPEGQSRYRDLRLDISYLDFEHEQSRSWTSTDIWRASRGKVLYDPEGLIAELLMSKQPDAAQLHVEALDLAAEIRFRLDQLVPAWLYRGEAMAAHFVLNQAIGEVVRLIHLINGVPAPDTGWDVVLLDSLDRVPVRARQSLEEASRSGDLTAADASRRRYALRSLLQQCDSLHTPDHQHPEEPETGSGLPEMLRYLSKHSAVDLDTFLRRFDRHLLIQSPAFQLVWIDRQPAQTMVRFNHDRLNRIIQHELGTFLEHQQRLLRELASSEPDERES